MTRYLSISIYILLLYVTCCYGSPTQLSKKTRPSMIDFIPGLDVVGCGFDITKLESRLCIFDLNDYNDSSYWTDPYNQSFTFRVPNGFYVLDAPDYLEGDETQIIKNVYEYFSKTFYNNQKDPNGWAGFNPSSSIADIEFIQRRFYQFDNYLASTTRQISWYSLNVLTFPLPEIDTVLMKVIEDLPTKFHPNNESLVYEFDQFFQLYGTHVVVGSTMGGLVWQQDWFDSCLLRAHNLTWIREQAAMRIGSQVFGIGPVSTTNISQEWIKHSQYSMQLKGGSEFINITKWREWIPTIKRRPRAISYDLLPIDQVLPLTRKKREAVEKAAAYFRAQADSKERTYISKLEAIPKPSKSRCHKNLFKRSLGSNLLPSHANRKNKSDPSSL